MLRRTFVAIVAAAGGAFVAPRWALAQATSSARFDRVHEMMAGYVARGVAPGLVTLIAQGGEVKLDAIGTMALAGGQPMRRDTIFRIASMTKPITAAATMALIEDGTLSLDEPVDRLLPELASRRVLKRLDGPLDDTVPVTRPITVQDLLTLCMGFGLVFEPSYPIVRAAVQQGISVVPPAPPVPPPPDEWMRRLGALPLMAQPGERWLYNTGSDVLGVLVARAAGRPFEAFLRDRLFAPLGMKDTGFSVPADKLDRLATSYWTNPGTGKLDVYDGVADSQWGRPPAFPSGAGGLVSTVDDYLAFAQMMLNKGAQGATRILSPRSVEVMTTDQLTPGQKATAGPILSDHRGWGFGVAIVTEPDALSATPGRYGWEGGLGTSWFNDPQAGLVAIAMTQSVDYLTSGGAQAFWTSVYRAIAA
jgi:CubicO group peptidase (beta-lactamase class C family)